MNSRQIGILGTIIFHSISILILMIVGLLGCGGGNGGGTVGEAMGGIEVSLGEPDLGGPADESGYSPDSYNPPPSNDVIDPNESITEDDANAPEMNKQQQKPVISAPKITPPKVKNDPTRPTNTNTTPSEPKIDTKGQMKKGGNKGSGSNPGNEGTSDGNPYGDPDGTGGNGGNGGNGSGNGDGDGNGPGSGSGKGVGWGFKNFKAARNWNISLDQQASGKVIVKLCIDADGKIISTQAPSMGSTTTDKTLVNVALNAVKNMNYIRTGDAEGRNCGTVTFTFKAR